MIVINLQALFEIVMLLCVSFGIRQQNIQVTGKMIAVIFVDLVVIGLANLQYVDAIFVNIIYVVLFLYCKIQFKEPAGRTCCYLAITMLICSIWQLVAYYPVTFILNPVGLNRLTGTIVNLAGIFGVSFLKKKETSSTKDGWVFLKEHKYMLILGFFSLAMVCLTIGFKDDLHFSEIESLAIILFCLTLSLTIWQLNKRLQEIKYKEREIEILKKYNSSYSELIDTIRERQHDFHNDLNAMLGIAYSTEKQDEIIKKQQEFCNCIIENNKHSKLLNNINPIITGMLFVKVLQGEKKGCVIDYRVSSQQMNLKMSMMDVIELIGILFDNAIEEEQKYEDKKRRIYFELKDGENGEYFLIRNRIEKNFRIEEISQMFVKGKSEKGDGRGIGLYKVKRIVHKYNLDFSIDQVEHMGELYISFRIALI